MTFGRQAFSFPVWAVHGDGSQLRWEMSGKLFSFMLPSSSQGFRCFSIALSWLSCTCQGALLGSSFCFFFSLNQIHFHLVTPVLVLPKGWILFSHTPVYSRQSRGNCKFLKVVGLAYFPFALCVFGYLCYSLKWPPNRCHVLIPTTCRCHLVWHSLQM